MPTVATPVTHPKIIKPEGQAYMKALIFGPHGRGKTTFAGTAQLDDRTSPALIADFEGNTESLVGLDIDIWPVRNFQDYNELFAFLTRGGHKYKTVCVDSISETNVWALMHEMDRRVKMGGPGREEFPDQAQMQDYGAVLVQMRRLIRRFRDLPMHVIYTALDDTEPEPGEGMVKMPAMLGRMRREVGALMSVVGYLALDNDRRNEHDEPIRVMMLRDAVRMRIKARSSWGQAHTIPRVLDDPTVGKLLDVVYPTMKHTTNHEAKA